MPVLNQQLSSKDMTRSKIGLFSRRINVHDFLLHYLILHFWKLWKGKLGKNRLNQACMQFPFLFTPQSRQPSSYGAAIYTKPQLLGLPNQQVNEKWVIQIEIEIIMTSFLDFILTLLLHCMRFCFIIFLFLLMKRESSMNDFSKISNFVK